MKIIKYKFEYLEDNEANQKIISLFMNILDSSWKLDEQNPEYVFILGGDGTFLHFLNKYVNKNVKLIGINSGTLGFYTIGNFNELNDKKKSSSFLLQDKKYFAPLVLKTELIDDNNETIYTTYALNDLVVQSPLTFKAELFLNNTHKFLDYVGTGLILCTPTGSTGINKSNNGPIFFSSLNAYCLSFIMPINNSKYINFTNPFLFQKNEEFSCKITNSEIEFQIINDGKEIDKNVVKKTKIIKVTEINATCQIFMSYDTYKALQRLKNFF